MSFTCLGLFKYFAVAEWFSHTDFTFNFSVLVKFNMLLSLLSPSSLAGNLYCLYQLCSDEGESERASIVVLHDNNLYVLSQREVNMVHNLTLKLDIRWLYGWSQ